MLDAAEVPMPFIGVGIWMFLSEGSSRKVGRNPDLRSAICHPFEMQTGDTFLGLGP